MTNWHGASADTPELAEMVQRRFDATGLGYLATLRRDGSPRICGVEPVFHDGEVWIGMMPRSRKALDLRRDPRMALHSANVDKAVTDGDARISGRAVEHTSAEAVEQARQVFAAATGEPPPPGPMHLFTIDIGEVVFVRPEDDRLVIRTWSPGAGTRRHERA